MHKATWVSPDGKTVNQINHITISRKWRSLLDTRVKRETDVASDRGGDHLLLGTVRIKLKKYTDSTNRPQQQYNVTSDHHLLLGTVRIELKKYTDTTNRPQQQYNVTSDHHLLLGTVRIKLKKYTDSTNRPQQQYNVTSDHLLLLGTVRIKLKKYTDSTNRPQQQYNVYKLKSTEIKLKFNCAVRNRFEALEDMTQDSTDIVWATLQETWKEVCKEVLGKRERKHKTATWHGLNGVTAFIV
ncbi:hypothetical protein LSAT2_032815 [Lamellibrachia satsuma]|nr:hypothetical protein LSAT2_032815 [Lamellibrachia satsuma]